MTSRRIASGVGNSTRNCRTGPLPSRTMSLPVVILAAAFGAAAGAFVPRPASRLAVPWGIAVRSACADCNEPFGTWVRAGPACRCRRGGWWPAVTGSGAAAALVAATLGPVPELPVLLVAVVLGVLLAAVLAPVIVPTLAALPTLEIARYAIASAPCHRTPRTTPGSTSS